MGFVLLIAVVVLAFVLDAVTFVFVSLIGLVVLALLMIFGLVSASRSRDVPSKPKLIEITAEDRELLSAEQIADLETSNRLMMETYEAEYRLATSRPRMPWSLNRN
ncbi:hypothetical protein [Kiloniella sp. b19]|uniref:hypothetical protein n=1 Tax=Kiloniella sp. GXU_MW_B19 TaxID=3141326 RepID=UPI0031CFEA94